MKEYYLCLDVGGTQIKAAALDRDGNPAGELRYFPAEAKGERQAVLEHFAVVMEEIRIPGAEVAGIRIAFPGPFDYERGICLLRGLDKYDGLYGVNLRQEFADRLGMAPKRIRFTNDAAAYALGVVSAPEEAEPLAGLLSPELAEEFSAPYVKRIVEALQEDSFAIVYHNCGNCTIQMIDSILDTGAAACHFGNAIDMTRMLPLIPEDILVMGNIDPAGQFRNDTPESIREATLELMRACGGYRNFLISSGCDIPPMSKWENIDAFFVWGFMDSQETVSISPEMFEEFIFPCYKKISESFGLLSYGCCEPVDPIWENCISRLENLRKVSISPWCNEAYMGERLRGSKIIYHRKPSPNYLGTGTLLDEEAFWTHIRESLQAAKGCEMEITQRDVYTINKDISKAKRYVDIIKEEIVNCW